MITVLRRKLNSALSALRTANKSEMARSCWRSVRRPRNAHVSLRDSLDAAYKWICAAQDAMPDDGVSAWYDLIHGWSPSYPETTGYIIPTLLSYASVMREHHAADRAMRMADWEIEVQLPTGAVRSGPMGPTVGAAVFNTGQVLHGWAAAYKVTRDERYAEAIQKAVRWLLEIQDDDGAWRKELSLMTTSKVQTYNIRSAWGLALAGELLGEAKWTRAACKNAEWCLKRQRATGWFENNGFTDDESPLLHTIGYTLEGLAGLGTLLHKEEYVAAAWLGVQPLKSKYEKTGKLEGRYNSEWRSSVSWRCLTGEAQTALVLLMLAKDCAKDDSAATVAQSILLDLANVQDLGSSCPGIYGGLAGSTPVWGRYIPYCYINWAAKFYMDALLLAQFDARSYSLDFGPQADQQVVSKP